QLRRRDRGARALGPRSLRALARRTPRASFSPLSRSRGKDGGSMRLRSIAALAASLTFGCGPASTSQAPSAGLIRGAVRYGGDRAGPLRVGAFSTFPPIGEPLALVEIEKPSFPQAYELAGIPEGRYFVLAIVATDPMDKRQYHPLRDPGGAFGSYLAP